MPKVTLDAITGPTILIALDTSLSLDGLDVCFERLLFAINLHAMQKGISGRLVSVNDARFTHYGDFSPDDYAVLVDPPSLRFESGDATEELFRYARQRGFDQVVYLTDGEFEAGLCAGIDTVIVLVHPGVEHVLEGQSIKYIAARV